MRAGPAAGRGARPRSTRRRGPQIFDRSVWQRIRSAEGLLDEKYDAGALDRALERFLADKRLADTVPELIVPAYDMSEPGPYFFKTRNARERRAEDFPLTVVARATSAAPTYFEPLPVGERALVDGGVFAVNPAMCAFAEVLRFHPSADVVLLSLGTGQRTRSRRFADVDDWGLVEWARPILDVVFDGVSDAVDYQLRHVLGEERYWRLQVELTRASDDLDDASPENLRRAAPPRGGADRRAARRTSTRWWRRSNARRRPGVHRPARPARARPARSGPARRSRSGRRPTPSRRRSS